MGNSLRQPQTSFQAFRRLSSPYISQKQRAVSSDFIEHLQGAQHSYGQHGFVSPSVKASFIFLSAVLAMIHHSTDGSVRFSHHTGNSLWMEDFPPLQA